MGQRNIQSPAGAPQIDFEDAGSGLVLSLERGEYIVVGDRVVLITLDRIQSHKKARIRVLCSQEFSVHRGHIFAKIKEEGGHE